MCFGIDGSSGFRLPVGTTTNVSPSTDTPSRVDPTEPGTRSPNGSLSSVTASTALSAPVGWNAAISPGMPFAPNFRSATRLSLVTTTCVSATLSKPGTSRPATSFKLMPLVPPDSVACNVESAARCTPEGASVKRTCFPFRVAAPLTRKRHPLASKTDASSTAPKDNPLKRTYFASVATLTAPDATGDPLPGSKAMRTLSLSIPWARTNAADTPTETPPFPSPWN